MKKMFHMLIGIGTIVFFAGSLLFVFGQAVCLLIGQPAMLTLIEEKVDAVIFPAIALTGLLCYLYSCFYKKAKKSE